MIFDISPAITEQLGVWPGDTPSRREVLLDMGQGDNLTLSTWHSTVHVGAHADGANHYGVDSPGIDARPLEHYLGEAHVVRVAAQRGTRIRRDQLPKDLLAPRLLVRTDTFPDPQAWNEDFAGFEPSCIDALAEEGVLLVGIDTPSVDLFTSKDLPAHAAFLRNDVSILEGLVLNAVPEGVYELIALPLKLVGFDASPVRAILRALAEKQ